MPSNNLFFSSFLSESWGWASLALLLLGEAMRFVLAATSLISCLGEDSFFISNYSD